MSHLTSPLWESLSNETYRFSMHQAISILEKQSPKLDKVGLQPSLARNPLQLCSTIYLAFPPNDLLALQAKGQKPKLMVNFMGIAGIQGTLPLPFTEYILDRMHAKDFALRDFLDLFNHRFLSLFHHHRTNVFLGLTHRTENSYGKCIEDFLGEEPKNIPGLSHYAALFWQQPRSGEGLKTLLSDYFHCKVHIKPFKGAWHFLNSSYKATLGNTSLNFQKGIGNHCWIQNRGVEIHLTHLNRKQFYGFLPEGFLHKTLLGLVKRYIGNHHRIVLYLQAKPMAVGRLRLNNQGRLGYDSFLRIKRTQPLSCHVFIDHSTQ